MNRPTVLVIDDEQEQRQSIRSVLEREGYLVIEAGSCEDARSVHARHLGKIHLLVIDISLPGGNGYDLCEEILQIEPHLKVIFVSGEAGASFRRFANAPAASQAFLPKPFLLEEFMTLVKSAFESAGSAQTS